MPNRFRLVAFCALALAALSGQAAMAQEAPPTENVGLTAEALGTIPLAGEFAEVGSRVLRMRLLTVEPGGAIALHNHTNRPSVEYVLSGTAIEVRGAETIMHEAGTNVVADHTTEHFWRNTGTEPLVLLAVDIFEPPPM
jgi:mannose-6-phosphate isomerase-like protein (cupin superfamily)